MTIPQAAVDAARQVLLDEGLLDSDRDGQKHYRGYCDAVVTITLEAAMPEIRAQIIAELTDFSDTSYNYHPSFTEATFRAIRIVKGESK